MIDWTELLTLEKNEKQDLTGENKTVFVVLHAVCGKEAILILREFLQMRNLYVGKVKGCVET